MVPGVSRISKFANAKVATDAVSWLLIVIWTVQVMSLLFSDIAASKQYGANAKGFQHVDFLSTYTTGLIVRSDQASRVYDRDVQRAEYEKLISPAKVEENTYFQYPPYLFMLVSPLTLLSFRDAYLVWDALSIVVSVLGLLLVSRLNQNLKFIERLFVPFFVLASFPSADCIRDGQFALMLLGLFSLFTWSFVKKKDILAGLALGFVGIKPQYFLLLSISALVCKRFRLLGTTAATLLLLASMSALQVGWQTVLSYPMLALHAETTENFGYLVPERYICLRGLATILLPYDVSVKVATASTVIAILLTASIWYFSSRRGLCSPQWAMALSVLVLLVFNPHSLVYDAALMGLPIALSIFANRPSQLFRERSWNLRLWNLLLICYPAMTWVVMLMAPKVACAILPAHLLEAFSTNGLKGGLACYSAVCLLHIIILVTGMAYVCSGKARMPEQTPEQLSV